MPVRVEKEAVQAYVVRQCERKLKVIEVDADGIGLARASPLSRGIDKLPGAVLNGARTSVTRVLPNPPLLRTYCVRLSSCQPYLALIIAVSRYGLSSCITSYSGNGLGKTHTQLLSTLA